MYFLFDEPKMLTILGTEIHDYPAQLLVKPHSAADKKVYLKRSGQMAQEKVMDLIQNEQFLKKAFRQALIPCILSILSGDINILVDGILVGQRLGDTGLAAINLSMPVYQVLCVLGSFLVSGTAISASREMGRDDMERARTLCKQAQTLCLLVSVATTVLGLLFLQPLSQFLCSNESIRPMMTDYVAVTIAGAVPNVLLYIPFWFLRLEGKNRSITMMMVIMGVGNIILDLWFLYGMDLGVFGASLASVISTALACGFGLIRLFGKSSSFTPGICIPHSRQEWQELTSTGSPSALNNLFQTLRLLMINSLFLMYGGASMVAAFTAVNGILAFSECITGGVPQAASAMLGSYVGDRDNESAALLMRRQWRSGVTGCGVFSAIVILGSGFLSTAYGLSTSLLFPLICLSLSLFPGLLNSMLSSFYNISGNTLWANHIILGRVLLFPAVVLPLLFWWGASPWLFLPLSEVLTSLAWWVAVQIAEARKPGHTRYLRLDRSLEQEGKVLNFSVSGNTETVCESSERITAFCTDNGLTPDQTMGISLAMEEIMTLVLEENKNTEIFFDLRAFFLWGTTGIRIRYNGAAYNPFQKNLDEDAYLGARVIQKLAKQISYQRAFGMNTLQIFV